MDIKLRPELEAVLAEDMANGHYASVDEYIADAVECLHERRQWLSESLSEERARLKESIAQAKRGELLDEDEVRHRMKVMKVRWAAGQRV